MYISIYLPNFSDKLSNTPTKDLQQRLALENGMIVLQESRYEKVGLKKFSHLRKTPLAFNIFSVEDTSVVY